jgi:hypothetical protein
LKVKNKKRYHIQAAAVRARIVLGVVYKAVIPTEEVEAEGSQIRDQFKQR